MPNPGPGLFIDERARISTARAYSAALRFLRTGPVNESGETWREARQHLRPALGKIVRWYWANRDHDEQTTFADMKPEVRRLRQRLRRLQAAMEKLPRPAAHALNMQMSRRLGSGPVIADHFAKVRALNAALDQACTPILDRKNKKGRSVSVEKACASLWEVWEAVTGRPFVRQWETAKTPARLVAARGSHEFIKPDALFAQIVLRAVDPEVTVQGVRNGLKCVAETRPKSG